MLGTDITDQLANLKKSVVCSEKRSERPQNGYLNNSEKNSGLKNLKSFPKGRSGNPKGRPKGKLNYKTIRNMALIRLGKKSGKTPDEIETDIMVTAITEALNGNYRYYKYDMDRMFGKAVSCIKMGGFEAVSPNRIDLDMQRVLEKAYGAERLKKDE